MQKLRTKRQKNKKGKLQQASYLQTSMIWWVASAMKVIEMTAKP
jgi:hypothetical protein